MELLQFALPSELEELSELSQWVAYRLVWNESKGKHDKLPINPRDGTSAKANDAGTWSVFSEALSAIRRFKLNGVGFEFAGGYCGLDLDNVILEDGSLKEYAKEIVEAVNSYTEVSPSGKGLHVLCKLSVPLSEIGSRRRNDELGLEIYDSGRYFTITGQIYDEAKPITERTEAVRKIYDKYFINVRLRVIVFLPLMHYLIANCLRGCLIRVMEQKLEHYSTEILRSMMETRAGQI